MQHNPRVLVTGAAGFLGKAICNRLAHSAELIGLDICPPPDGWEHGWITASVGDCAGYEHQLVGIDAVIHAAWAGFPGSVAGFERDLSHNVAPTVSFYMKCCEAGVGRFIFLSSGGTVYGNALEFPIAENTVLRPVSLYGASKAAVEGYLCALEQVTGVPAVIIRVANPYGPGQLPWRGQGAIATAVACALSGTVFTVWGDGENLRDYLFIDDVAEAIVIAALASTESDVYNVSSGIGRSLNDVLSCVEAASGRSLRLVRVPSRNMDVKSVVLSPNKIKSQLNWESTTAFEDGVSMTCDWLQQNKSAWISAPQVEGPR